MVATVVFDTGGRSDPEASRVEVEASWEDGDRRDDDGELRARRERRYVEAVRAGLRRWRWEPDTVDGRPIRGEFTVALHFASKGDRMRREWSPPPLRPAIYRPLPEAGVAPATLLSWGPAKDPPVSAAE